MAQLLHNLISFGCPSSVIKLRKRYSVIGLTLVATLISCLQAINNGLQEVRTYILINVAQSLLTLLLTVGLIAWLGLDGALIAVVTNQSLVLVVLLWMLRGHIVINAAHFRLPFDCVEASHLSKYSLMAAVSAIVTPLTAILVQFLISGQR